MFTLTAATTTETNSNSQQLLALLFPTLAEKAWRGGGGMGASSGLGGLLLQQAVKARRTGPGSRGGHFWMNASGHVEYGPKPSGIRAVATGRGGGSGKPRVGELRPGYRIKPQTATGKVQQQRRMLSEMDRVISTGKDPHGNRLSAENLSKLRFLATSLRTDLKGPATTTTRKKERSAGAALKETLIYQAYKALLPTSMPLAAEDPNAPASPEPGHTGVMVAFYLDTFSPDAAVKLQVPGGEPWDALHLTLAYLGNSTELDSEAEGQLYQTISEFAANREPLEGTVSGIGLFNNTEEGDSNAFYASFDSPGLPDFRAQLMGMLQANGLMPIQNHGFTPHITLQYVPKGQPLPNIELPQMSVIFPQITVKWGDKRTDFSLGRVEKEVKNRGIKETQPGGSFTVFKDVKGNWHWISVSSSGFQDNDGETIATKALAEDTARCDAQGSYGPLDWWHTPIVLGQCDFNAMHGKLLVESGTFNNPLVAQRIAEKIASKEFVPGISLEFAHNMPGPQVVPGRVFDKIHKYRRALLPAHIASNMASTFQVVNPALNTGQSLKEIKGKKMDAHKEQRLRELLGPELVDEFLSGTARSEKALELAGVSYKAAAALGKPMEPPVTNAAAVAPAAATPDVMVAKKDDMVDPMAAELGAGDEGGEPGGGFEDSPADADTDAILENLFSRIGQIVTEAVKGKVDEILSAVNGLGQASTKETAAMEGIAISLKETANALTAVSGENKVLKEQLVALKERLDVLDGKQPPAVRARASQTSGLSAAQLPTAIREMVSSEKQAEDPYLAAAGNFLRGWSGGK